MKTLEISDHSEEEEENEMMSLIVASPLSVSTGMPPVKQSRWNLSKRKIVYTGACLLLGGIVGFATQRQHRIAVNNTERRLTCPHRTNIPGEYQQACRKHVEWFDELRLDAADYLSSHQFLEYDNFGHSYQEVKQGLTQWKTQRFKSLHNHSTIYESGSGVGMSLYMTLEILHEQLGIERLHVYGNDMVAESIQISETTMKRLPGRAHTESICNADSTDLWHLPDNSFDLVFSGIIPPLLNPLNLPGTEDETSDVYMGYCHSRSRTKAHQAQAKQEEWYRAWTEEMIRIARPGAPIIVEFVSFPFCDGSADVGGVKQNFWAKMDGINRSSILFEDDLLSKTRYHVYMEKNDPSNRQ